MGKTFSQAQPLITQNTLTARSPIKVCMHVLGQARTDVRVMREATALVEAGFDVSIIDIEREYTLTHEEKIRGTSMKHIAMPGWFIPTRFKPWFLVKAAYIFFRSVFRLLQTRTDIYHAHDETALPACYIAARLRRKPLIFDAHELPFTEQRNWPKLHAIAVRLLARMVPYCAGIITVSPPIAQEIHKLYHGSEVTLIRNVPEYRSVEKSDRLKQHLDLGPEKRIALYQGVLQSDRELDRLIRAAHFLEEDIIIVMMGKGPEKIVSQLETLIVSEGVADRVKIIPAVPYEELLDWSASADIGLIIYSPDYSPNIRMCLPNKFFEYLMAGLPILSSELEVVGNISRTYDVGKVVSSLTSPDIAAAINTMLADTVELDHMHHNALEAVQYEFCWEKERGKLTRLYQDILAVENY